MCVCIYTYIYHSFFIRSSVSGHLGCFHDLAIENSVSANIGAHVFFELWISQSICPEVGLLGLVVC